jgi:hypothetical protein
MSTLDQTTPENLPQIVWQNQHVVTTELLAQCYGTNVACIQMNYSRNQSRFIEGKHFFKVEGETLKNLRLTESYSQISSKTRSLMLWTEKGAARHAKILDTDAAWDVFERMEEVYFHPERRSPPALSGSGQDARIMQLQEHVIGLQQQLIAQLQAPASPAVQFGAPRQWTPELDAQMQQLRAAGYGDTRIGFIMGCSGNAIRHRRRRLQGGAS